MALALLNLGCPTKQFCISERTDTPKSILEIFLIEEVLKNPLVIFRGLERADLDDGFCYCAVPKMRHIAEDGSTAPAHPGVLFAVFCDKDRTIFEFGWERMAGDQFGYPEQYETRFAKPVFP